MDIYIWRCFSFFLDYSPLDSHHFSFIAAWLSSFTYCSNLLFFMSALGDNCTTTVIPTTNTLQTTGAQVCSAAPGGNVVQVRFTGDTFDEPTTVVVCREESLKHNRCPLNPAGDGAQDAIANNAHDGDAVPVDVGGEVDAFVTFDEYSMNRSPNSLRSAKFVIE